MIFLYRIAYIPLLLLLMPYYALRMIRRGGYSKDFSHRFGLQKNLPPPAEGKSRVWIQAVSVGEVEALSGLLKLLSESGKYEVVITTTTSTAYKILREKFSRSCLYVGVFPFDFYFFNRSAWKRIKPDICVLMEGELWPEHMHRANQKKVPLLLLNARLSDKSFGHYKKSGRLGRRLLAKIDYIGAGSEFDRERFMKLGVDAEKIENTGNLKFDSKPEKVLSDAEKSELKKELGFGENSFVLLGSSTWPGEECMLVDASRKIAGDSRLLIVPRHAERRGEIRGMLEGELEKFHFRSDDRQAPSGTVIYVADTTGELKMLTQIADLAFVGKSLPPNDGGQTPIDCAAFGIPMVYGPNMSNFRLLTGAMEEAGAALKVQDREKAELALAELAANPERRMKLGENARLWHASNLGASEKSFKILKRFTKK